MRGREITIPEGGRAFNVFINTNASATVPVVLTAEDLTLAADDYGVAVSELTVDELHELLVDRAIDQAPTLGVCCSGGIWAGEPSLELGDNWVSDADGQHGVTPADSVTEITPKSGA